MNPVPVRLRRRSASAACRCTPMQVARYASRLSGPLRDRIDLDRAGRRACRRASCRRAESANRRRRPRTGRRCARAATAGDRRAERAARRTLVARARATGRTTRDALLDARRPTLALSARRLRPCPARRTHDRGSRGAEGSSGRSTSPRRCRFSGDRRRPGAAMPSLRYVLALAWRFADAAVDIPCDRVQADSRWSRLRGARSSSRFSDRYPRRFSVVIADRSHRRCTAG